jgi:hypothetical protein
VRAAEHFAYDAGTIVLEVTVSDVWSFKKDFQGHWMWQRESLHHELLEQARLPFKELEECVADARRRGYTGSLSAVGDPPRDASGRLVRLTRR